MTTTARTTRPRIARALGAVVAAGCVSLALAPTAHAVPLPDGACEYVTAISASADAPSVDLAAVAAPGSDAYAYGVFERDLRDAAIGADHDPRRVVRCGRTAVEVDLLQYDPIPIKPPKKVTTTYDRFDVDPDGRVRTFSVNGTPVAGRVLVGDGAPEVALGTSVALASAYRVPRTGGESIKAKRSLLVLITATAPADGLRDLATGATTYRTADDEHFVRRVVGQGSALEPGAEATFLLVFDAREFGGTLTVPVVAAPAAQAGPDTPLEAARLLVAPLAE